MDTGWWLAGLRGLSCVSDRDALLKLQAYVNSE